MNYNINYSEKITKVALKWVKLNFNLDDFFHFFEFFYIYTSVKSIFFLEHLFLEVESQVF